MQDFRTLVLSAQKLIDKDDCTTAIDHLKKALATTEFRDAQIHYNLAFCYKQLNNRRLMFDHAREGHEIDPSNAPISILLGNELLSDGAYHSAIAAYKSALFSPSSSSLANWNLAVAYARTGDYQKVRSHLSSISTTSPRYQNAQAWVATLDDAGRRIKLFGISAICFFAVTTVLLIVIIVRQFRQAMKNKAELRVEIATAIIGGLFTILSSLLTFFYGSLGS